MTGAVVESPRAAPRELVADARSIGPGAKLVPQRELHAAIADLEASLLPIDRALLEDSVKRLGGMKAPPNVPDLKVFWQNVARAVADFPRDVVIRAVDEAVNRFIFCPGPAELRKVAAELLAPRLRQIETARAMRREHERRARAAEQVARHRNECAEAPRQSPVAASGAPRLAAVVAPPQDDAQLAATRLARTGRQNEIERLWLGLMESDAATIAKAQALAEEERNARRAAR